jgi:hypothetical protein
VPVWPARDVDRPGAADYERPTPAGQAVRSRGPSRPDRLDLRNGGLRFPDGYLDVLRTFRETVRS